MTSSLVAEMRAVISKVLPVWEDAGLDPPVWAMALHPQVAEKCGACGAWGTLIPGAGCSHAAERRGFVEVLALTTIGGETIPLTTELLTRLLVEGIWLAGQVPATIRRMPIQQPDWPVLTADLVLSVGPTLTATDLESSPIYARLAVDLIRRPLILLCQHRPMCLPK